MPPSERDSLDDAEFLRLLALARQGDREALGKIWEHVERLLLKIASEDLDPRIRARVAPSDLVQRAYLSVQNGINSFEATQFCNFRNWVQTILRNVMIDESRTQFAEQRDVRKETGIKDGGRSGEVANGQHPVAKSPSPSSHFRKSEELALLARCLLELSADHRRVIELRVKENLEVTAQ